MKSASPSAKLQGKLALVTGAGSGIGRATALLFARTGADLALCDVDETGLLAVAAEARALGRTVIARRVDVANRDQMRDFAAEVHGAHAAVDVLVNNAGVGLGATFLDTTLEDWDWVISINLFGVIHGCHFFIPRMVEKGRGGQVVNLSSAAGFFASSTLAGYSTTKFGVFGLSEALREELKPHRIGVSTICPGIIDTPIARTTRMRGPSADPAFHDKVVAFYKKRNYGPDKVAAAILDAVLRNRAVVPVTPEAWALYLMKRVSPGVAAGIWQKLAARFGR